MINIQRFAQQLAQIKRQMGNTDPNAYIQKLMQEGKVTQEQYNQAVKQAQSIQKMLGK